MINPSSDAPVACCEPGEYGRLGNGTTDTRLEPFPVSHLTGVFQARSTRWTGSCLAMVKRPSPEGAH